jgi:bifunctional DNA-binding transcriptional regulator/antitoxin component of YhaV-PrlF toxin-antitoxin module
MVNKDMTQMTNSKVNNKDSGFEKSRIRISNKRQITIPAKYFEALKFEKEIECIMSNGMLILIPVKEEDSFFTEEILKDLIERGYSGDRLLDEFKKMNRKVKPAIEKLIEEADKVAESALYNHTDKTDDIFGD